MYSQYLICVVALTTTEKLNENTPKPSYLFTHAYIKYALVAVHANLKIDTNMSKQN